MTPRFAIKHKTTGQFIGCVPSVSDGITFVSDPWRAAAWDDPADAEWQRQQIPDFADTFAVVSIDPTMPPIPNEQMVAYLKTDALAKRKHA